MRDVIDDIQRWQQAGERAIALATVVQTWGSAPRKVGAKMAFTPGGAAISGSVSGGCVEGAVIETGDAVLAGGPPQLLHFGVADETAWSVGLACGGTIEVFVEQLNPGIFAAAQDWIDAGVTCTLLTLVRGPDDALGRQAVVVDGRLMAGSLAGGADEGKVMDEELLAQVAVADHGTRLPLPDGSELFVDVVKPAPTLIMVGGAHIAVALAQLAKIVGYGTVVIDPRRAFGSEARFPAVDRLVHAWPDKALASLRLDSETAVVTLSHDPKIDDPALRAALASEVFYVGALGSRKTHTDRRERLLAAGVSPEALDRIHAPIGLDIGADNPEEIALAIMAEVVQTRRSVGNRL